MMPGIQNISKFYFNVLGRKEAALFSPVVLDLGSLGFQHSLLILHWRLSTQTLWGHPWYQQNHSGQLFEACL